MLLYDKLDDLLDNYGVSIISEKADIRLTGLINNPSFSYSNSASLSNNTAVAMTENLVKGSINSITKRTGTKALWDAIKGNFQTLRSTYRGYDSADITSFSITMHLFPNKFRNGSVKDIEYQLSKLTQPDTKFGDKDRDGKITDYMKSYLYDVNTFEGLEQGKDVFKGQLLSLYIGKHFRIDGDLFCDSVSRDVSKWVTVDGTPIYKEVTFNLSTYRVMNAEEQASWVLR